jgi:hypothetical protein
LYRLTGEESSSSERGFLLKNATTRRSKAFLRALAKSLSASW